MRLFILAGEPSGDRIGADLVRRLKSKSAIELVGVGGPELAAEGLNSLYPMDDLSVMGLSDVLKRLPLLFWRVEQTARVILKLRPDVVVLIDAQEFSALVAKRLRKAGYDAPLLLYVAPSVWARKPERAPKLKALFDEVLAVLPLEPEVMRKLGGPPTNYVGHPATAEIAGQAADPQQVALLPGSRRGELRRHMPLFRDIVAELAKTESGFFIPTLPHLAEQLVREVADWAAPVRIVSKREERHAFYADTKLAISCAGTATLELALSSVPMVITYVMDRMQARHFRLLGQPRVGLPNIILGEGAVPELVLGAAAAEPVLKEARHLLQDASARAAQHAAFSRLQRAMLDGFPGAEKKDPADRVLSHVAVAADQRLASGS